MAGQRRRRHEDYTVGWVCALPVELAAAQEMLDEKHGDLVISTGENNIYTLGRIGEHNVVITSLPDGQLGTNSAAAVAAQIQSAFTCIQFGLMVGIGGGVPLAKADIRLGDVVVSRPENNHSGVVQYDFGKNTPSGFKRTGFLNAPPRILQNAVSHLKAKHMRGESCFLQYTLKFNHLPTFTRDYAGPDVLFESHYNHVGGTTCENCDKERILRRSPRDQQGSMIHYGTIASGNQVMRNAAERDRVSADLGGVLCFEMEAAGLLNEFPCLVIRGICDYSDSHKNKTWQPYAAGVAAAYAKELLSVIPSIEVKQSPVVEEVVGKLAGAKELFTVPFQRDDKFVGREFIMTNLDDKFQSTAAHNHLRVALVGIGGIGKSQIAIEYTYRARQRDPNLSVFWVYAGNAARYEQAYRDLADKLDLAGRDNPAVDIFKLVSRWLSEDTNGQWLMILDNADNEDMFFQEIEVGVNPNLPKASARAPLIASIPQTTNGSVIITTRSLTAARNLVGLHENIISVDVMDEKDALDLLQTKVVLNEQSLEDGQRLIQVLEYIPLAINQAGSYIQVRSPRVTVSEYLILLEESEASLLALLGNKDVRDFRRDYSSEHMVIATWQMSFNQIQISKPAASDLLALMSMFDRQGIPEHLLQQGMTQLQFEDAVHPLISFSLIKESKGKRSFAMHRLVQISIRRWLESNNQLELWATKSAEVIAAAFPSGEFETWAECQILIPHAKEIMRQAPENQDSAVEATPTGRVGLHYRRKRRRTTSKQGIPKNDKGLLQLATIRAKAGWYLFLQGRFQEAEAMQQRALGDREKVLSPKHPDTLTSVSNLGSVLESQGKYEEAEAMHRRALRDREKVLSLEHPDTLTSISNLGSVLQSQGKYEEAEVMHRRAFKGYEKVLGPEHPHTLTSVNNLGSVLESQGKYEEAEVMHRRVLRDREKVLGPEHPDTLTSVSNLGSVLESQGKYEEAEVMHRRVLRDREKVLGPEHPDTLTSVSKLGLVLQSQGKCEEAEVIHRRALKGREKVLGPEHPDTLTSVSKLGSVLQSQGKYEEAEVMHRCAFKGYEKVLGPEHPHTLTSVNNLGLVLESQGKYEEAEAMHQHALNGYEKVLSLEHPYTLTSVSNLGSVLKSQGKYEEAKVMHRRALRDREKVLGPEHPDTLTSVSKLGSVLQSQGKYEEAEVMHRRAFKGYEKVLGPEHPHTLTSVNNLGLVLTSQGKYEEADVMHRRALRKRANALPRMVRVQ